MLQQPPGHGRRRCELTTRCQPTKSMAEEDKRREEDYQRTRKRLRKIDSQERQTPEDERERELSKINSLDLFFLFLQQSANIWKKERKTWSFPLPSFLQSPDLRNIPSPDREYWCLPTSGARVTWSKKSGGFFFFSPMLLFLPQPNLLPCVV